MPQGESLNRDKGNSLFEKQLPLLFTSVVPLGDPGGVPTPIGQFSPECTESPMALPICLPQPETSSRPSGLLARCQVQTRLCQA